MWEPLSVTDYLLLAFAGIHQALVSATVVHLVACRKWPPYLVKNIPLVCVTGIAGCVHLLGVVMTFGFWEHSSTSLASNCFFQGLVLWTGAGLYYTSAVVRVYRNYKVLVRHSVDMLSPTKQILLLQIPVWGLACFLLVPSVATMDFELNRCTGNARFLLLGAFNYGGVLLIGAAFLLYKMKDVRKQMNEYQSMTVSLGFLLLTTVAVDASAGDIAQDDVLARRIALLSNMVRGALLFWPVIWTPLVKYVKKDSDYAERFSVGLVPSVTPAVLRASLADQLKVEELWGHFEKIAEERLSSALPGFYKAVMERDKEEGHFERQAMTMDIVNTYVADNALCPVNISEPCRQRILASEVTRYTIFNEAAAEVLEVLRTTCEDAFQACPAYEVLLRRAEKDEAQLEALGKAKLVRKKEVGFSMNTRGDRSGPSRFDRWTNSTAAERRHKRLFSDDESRGGGRGGWFVPRLWCCSWSSWRRTASLASIGSSTSTTSNKARPTAGAAAGAAGASSADKRWRRNRPRHGTTSTSRTTPATCTHRGPVPARTITLGNRSELASQHGAGELNSPLDWLAEEAMERRESSFDARANTGGLSSLSATSSNYNHNHNYTYNNAHGNYITTITTTTHNNTHNSNTSHLFGRTLTRTTTSSPLPERHGGAEGAPPDELEEHGGGSDASRGLNSPTTSLTPVHRPWPELPRPPHTQKQQQQQQQQQRRPPPTPWAPWRRQPSEPSIAPVTSSPAESHVNDHAGAGDGSGGGGGGGDGNAQGHGAAGPVEGSGGRAAAAAAVGRGPCFAARTVSSAGSLESLVMFLPPSPATPIRGAPGGGSADGKAEGSAAAAAAGGEGGADAEGRGSGPEDGRGASGGRPAQKGFVPIAPWRNWVNSTFMLEEEEEEEDAEEKKRGGDGEPFMETCADFVEKSGFVPSTGFQPKTTWLELALQKEETEKRAEEVRQEEAEQARRDLREKRGRGLIGWRGWHGGGGKGGKGNRSRQEATSKSPASCSPKSASALPGGEAALGSRELEDSTSPPPRPLPYPLSLSSSSHSLPPASPSASQQSTSSSMPEVFPSLPPLGETTQEMSLTQPPPSPPPPARSMERLAGTPPPPPPRGGVSQSMGGAVATAEEGRGVASPELSPSPWPSLTMASSSPPSTHRRRRGFAAASALPAPEGESEDPEAAGELDTAAVEVRVAEYTKEIHQHQHQHQQTVAYFKMASVSPSPSPPLPPPSPPPPAALTPGALSFPAPPRPPSPSPHTLPGDGVGRAAEEEVDQTPERPRSLATTPPRAERPARARMAPAGAKKATRENCRESASWGGTLAAGAWSAVQPAMTTTAPVLTASMAASSASSASDKKGLVTLVSSKHPARAQPARAAAWRDPPPPQASADRRPTAPAREAALVEAEDAMRARSGGGVACLPATSRPPSTPLPAPVPDVEARGGFALAPPGPAASAAAAAGAAAAADASRATATAGAAMSTSSGSPSPSPCRPSPPPVNLMLSLTTVEAPPCYRLFTPPSPAGRSTSSPCYSSPPMSATSSSFKSSPPQARPRLLPLLPPPAAVVLSGREFLPPSAVPPAWSLSDSSHSCCRSTNGGGGVGVGGISSLSAASACSEAASASPLIGMRFVFAGTDCGSSSAGGGGIHSSSRDRLRPDSWSDHGGGAPPIGVRASPPLCHPPVGGGGGAPVALGGVGRTAVPGEEEKVHESDAAVDAAIAAAINVAPEKLSLEGGVGGRRGKRPRRYFFP